MNLFWLLNILRYSPDLLKILRFWLLRSLRYSLALLNFQGVLRVLCKRLTPAVGRRWESGGAIHCLLEAFGFMDCGDLVITMPITLPLVREVGGCN